MKYLHQAILVVFIAILLTIFLMGIAWMPFWLPLVSSTKSIEINHVPMHLNSSQLESICNPIVRTVVVEYTGYCDEVDPVDAYRNWRQSEVDNAEININKLKTHNLYFAVGMTIFIVIAMSVGCILIVHDAVQRDRTNRQAEFLPMAHSQYTSM